MVKMSKDKTKEAMLLSLIKRVHYVSGVSVPVCTLCLVCSQMQKYTGQGQTEGGTEDVSLCGSLDPSLFCRSSPRLCQCRCIYRATYFLLCSARSTFFDLQMKEIFIKQRRDKKE